MLDVLVVLLTLSHTITPYVMPSNEPAKALWTEDANESSESNSVNLFWWGSFSNTNDPAPFSDTYYGGDFGSGSETELVLKHPGRMLAKFFTATSTSLIIRQLAYKIGR